MEEKYELRQQKLKAGRLLGLRDENLKPIPFDKRDKESILVTIEILKKSHSAVLASKQAENECLQKKIKSLLKGKSEANRRADAAEAKLKAISKVIGK